MRKTIPALVAIITGALWPKAASYVWEFGRTLIYEHIWHMIESSMDTPHLFEYGPSAVLIFIGFYLFWSAHGRPGFDFNFAYWRVPFDDAAQRIYEAAERADKLDVMVSSTSRAEDKLNIFKTMLLVEDRVRLFGAKPPSTQSLLIPKKEVRGELYPSTKTPNALDHLRPTDHPPAFVNVTVPRSDLRRIIKIYLTEYVSEAKQMRRGQWPR
jgi:hypothetical protein